MLFWNFNSKEVFSFAKAKNREMHFAKMNFKLKMYEVSGGRPY
jgi:hypothetical protein